MAKMLVTFEDDLLRRVDRVVKLHGLTRSACLSQLAARATAQEKGQRDGPPFATDDAAILRTAAGIAVALADVPV